MSFVVSTMTPKPMQIKGVSLLVMKTLSFVAIIVSRRLNAESSKCKTTAVFRLKRQKCKKIRYVEVKAR
jgi:hypothetical protein